MSKKLLIAVLLGLLFIYLGNAVATDNNTRGFTDRQVRKMVNPNAPQYGQEGAVPVQNHVQKYGRPSGNDGPNTKLLQVPVPPAIIKKCDTVAAAVNETYVTTVPNVGLNRDMIAQKFSRINGFETCTLKTAYISYYPAFKTGSPDLQVSIWDDALGYPGTILGTVTVPFSSLPLAFAYVPVDFSSQNIVIHGNFYVSVGTPTVGALYPLLTDDDSAGTGSSYVHQGSPQVWYTRAELGYLDYNYDIIVDKCCIDPT